GAPGLTAPAKRVSRKGLCVPLRAQCPTDRADDSSYYQPGRHHCRLTLPSPSAYVTARVRILPGEQEYGYARHPTVSGASQHPTHRTVYRTRATAVSRLLGRLTIASQSCLAAAVAPNDSSYNQHQYGLYNQRNSWVV